MRSTLFETLESAFERMDSLVNTRALRSHVRTGIGESLSRLALLSPRPNEQISDEFDRVYFHHIRKTAGTSIVVAFFALSGSDPRKIERRLYRYAFTRAGGMRFVGPNTRLIQGGRYFFAYSHFPSYVARPPTARTFAFTVLRDPVERVVSLYRYLRSQDSDEGFTFRAPPSEQFWAQGTLGRFLDRIPQTDLLRQLYMFSPTGGVSETVDTLGTFHLVIHTKTLGAGVEILKKRTGVTLDVGHQRVSSASIEIPQSQLDRAREMLEPEYEMLHQLGRTAQPSAEPQDL
jgi:hypothetical protein